MNKIGWCDMTWNPVWGCRNHCEYCYARAIAKRFWKVVADNEYQMRCIIQGATILKPNKEYEKFIDNLKYFKPEFLYSQYHKELPKKPQRIFVGSMSEIYYWDEEWIEMVIEKVKQYPQHTFQFLTKHMEVYADWIWPKNCILGVTITDEKDFGKRRGDYYFCNSENNTFFSFEPLLGEVGTEYLKYSNIDWVIIGAETGNRKGKVIPSLEWVANIVNYCKEYGIPVYVKDSIKGLYPNGYKQFPKKEIVNE